MMDKNLLLGCLWTQNLETSMAQGSRQTEAGLLTARTEFRLSQQEASPLQEKALTTRLAPLREGGGLELFMVILNQANSLLRRAEGPPR